MRKKLKLVYGWGINDADYAVQPVVNGKQVSCAYYSTWHSVVRRCYSEKSQIRHPTYRGCSISDSWKQFMTFREWMITQDWEGKSLDKDIMIVGNREYGPNACLFVSRQVNNLLNDCKGTRGEFPIGVSFDKESGRYKASCCIDGKNKNLGRFDCPNQAHLVYRAFKRELILSVAYAQSDNRIRDGLLLHASLLEAV